MENDGMRQGCTQVCLTQGKDLSRKLSPHIITGSRGHCTTGKELERRKKKRKTNKGKSQVIL